MRAIDNLPEEKLRPEFLSGMEELRAKILEGVEPKTVMGKTISGPGRSLGTTAIIASGFLNLIESYVDAINTGAVPDIQSTWESVARQENARQRDRIVNVSIHCYGFLIPQEYKKNMNDIGEKPLEQELISLKHEEYRMLAMEQFFLRVMDDPSLCIGKLEVPNPLLAPVTIIVQVV